MSKIDFRIVQHNPTVGALRENQKMVFDKLVRSLDVDVVVFPELTLCGYPPQDFLIHDEFLGAHKTSLKVAVEMTGHSGYPAMILGGPIENKDGRLENTCVFAKDGEIVETYAKRLLPTYDVFNEHRYFTPGDKPSTVTLNETKIALTVCEDAWQDARFGGRREHDYNPFDDIARDVDVIINLSASPFRVGKQQERVERFTTHAEEVGAPVIVANQVGANDDLIFDGRSFVATGNGVKTQLEAFETDTQTVTIDDGEVVLQQDSPSDHSSDYLSDVEELRDALLLGIEDYFSKTGFDEAVIGLSGGIDSSLTATLAADALGPENIHGVSIPSSITSEESVEDACELAQNLGINFSVSSITELVNEFEGINSENDLFSLEGVVSENLQARLRGILLMTVANSKDALVLTPGNKSEAGVGYCTLYGDTVGAIAPLGDCYKRQVYSVAELYNNERQDAPIPERVIEKPPTAELSEGQTDEDELPPYETLDGVLSDFMCDLDSVEELYESYPEAAVDETIERLQRSEFKRAQTPMPLRVSERAFGKEWQYPIAASYPFPHDFDD